VTATPGSLKYSREIAAHFALFETDPLGISTSS
jgi:hypothetical protein